MWGNPISSPKEVLGWFRAVVCCAVLPNVRRKAGVVLTNQIVSPLRTVPHDRLCMGPCCISLAQMLSVADTGCPRRCYAVLLFVFWQIDLEGLFAGNAAQEFLDELGPGFLPCTFFLGTLSLAVRLVRLGHSLVRVYPEPKGVGSRPKSLCTSNVWPLC